MSSLAKRNADVEASDTSNMAYQLTRIMSSHGSEAGGTIVLNASWLSIEVPAGRRYDIPLKDLHGLAYHEPLCSDTSLTIETRRAVIHHVAEEPQELKNLTLQVLFANETLSSQLRTLVQGTDWAGSRPHAVFDAFERGVPTWATPLIRRGMYRPWMRTAFFIGWLIFVVSTLLLALIDFHAVFTELVPTFGFSFQEAKEAGGDSDGSGKKLQRILGPLAPIAVMGQNVMGGAAARAIAFIERSLLSIGVRKELLIRFGRGIGQLGRAFSQFSVGGSNRPSFRRSRAYAGRQAKKKTT